METVGLGFFFDPTWTVGPVFVMQNGRNPEG